MLKSFRLFCEIFLTSFIFQGIARLQRHEQIVDEVKLALKPFFRHGEITKDDYKVIMRKSVEKVCLREFFQSRTCYYPEKQSLNRGETSYTLRQSGSRKPEQFWAATSSFIFWPFFNSSFWRTSKYPLLFTSEQLARHLHSKCLWSL